MRNLLVFIAVLFAASENLSASDIDKTLIHDQEMAKALAGKHRLTLQWISRKLPGEVIIDTSNDLYRLSGIQNNEGKKDIANPTHFMQLDGVIIEIGKTVFVFEGTIQILLGGRNDNRPCVRKGKFTFSYRKGKSRSWRLKESLNECHDHTDYVDIFVDRKWRPNLLPKHKPTQADKWGIGLISDKKEWPPGYAVFPNQSVSLYDNPDGKIVASASIAKNTWDIDIKTATDSKVASKKDMKEIAYESSAPIVFQQQQHFVNVFRQYLPKGLWIDTRELAGYGYYYISWLDYIINRREGRLFPRDNIAINLRTSHHADAEKIATLKGELINITPTGQKNGQWIKVNAVRYAVHPCTDGKGEIVERWQGWLKSVDDAGYPNLWYYTRGC